ncbi:MAG TPA: hypothetical protein VIL35_03525 [Vicinamibacterales bacterium]
MRVGGFVCLLVVCAAAVVPAQSTVVVNVAPAGEPGERLLVSGRIVGPRGPVANAAVRVYQTDAKGYYSPQGLDERNARLNARFSADGEGRFRFATIKPGPYPGSGPPAHIHFEVTPPEGRTERFELVFEGDPRLSQAIRQDARSRGFYQICQPTKDAQGALLCEGVEFEVH